MLRKRIFRVIAGSIAILGSATTSAQVRESFGTMDADPPVMAVATPQEDDARELETVIVTAQKRTQALQDVPLSISVIPAGDLVRSGVFDASSLEERVPNVEIDVDAQAPVIGIRGFSTDTDNVGFEPAVGLVVDDVPLGRPEFIADGLFDLDHVEILRGPQGTLFGKNTIAGVIAFKNVEPTTDGRGHLLAAIDERGSKRAEVGQSLALGKSAALRIAGVTWNRDGDLENTTRDRKIDDFEQNAGRMKLSLWTDDALTVQLSTQLSVTRGAYGPLQLYDASDSALAFSRHYDPDVEDDPRDSRTSQDLAGRFNRDTDISRILVNYDLDDRFGLRDLVTTFVVAHAGVDLGALIDADVSPAALAVTDFGLDDRQNSLEWRLAGGSKSLFGIGEQTLFVIGIYAFQAKLTSHLDALGGDDLIAFGTSPAGFEALGGPNAEALLPLFALLPTIPGVRLDDSVQRDFGQKTRSEAVFGQLEWQLDESWSAIAGARLTQENKRARQRVSSTGVGIVKLVLGSENFDTRRHRSEVDFSPKLGFIYRWSEDLNLFATATRGFKSGGYNAIANTEDDLEFEPERATNIEAGLKATWLDGSLRTQLSVYQTDVSDLQVIDLLGPSLRVGNAAEARLRGVEAELAWLPSARWLRIDAALGFSNAEYRRYRDAVPTEQQSDDDQDSQDLSGRTLPNAPEWSALLSPTVILPWSFGHGLGVECSVDAAYRGDQYSATDLDPHSHQKGYWLFGASMALGQKKHGWTLVMSGTNLADEKALDLVIDDSIYDDTYTGEQIPRRSVRVSLVLDW